MDDRIDKLKEYVKIYNISMNWYYGEKYTEDEYKGLIGKYFNYRPDEILDDMFKFIDGLK